MIGARGGAHCDWHYPSEGNRRTAAVTPSVTAQPLGSSLIGRDHELAIGLAVFEDVVAGHGKVLLLAGEPGIGKSRLADELAVRIRARDAMVVWGRCWEAGGAPAYWPWVQCLRSLVRGRSPDELHHQMGTQAVHIAHMLPELRETLRDLPSTPGLDPEEIRFRVFDGVMLYLSNLATQQPIVMVLDDLQVADTSSLLLLRFLAGALAETRVLIVGTFRDTELPSNKPLAATLRDLTRMHVVRRLTLQGLTEADVKHLIKGTTGVMPNESLVQTVHQETEGNPLFVEEVTRLLHEEGRLESGMGDPDERVVIPRSVREVIGLRLRGHSPDCLRILTLASVLGREFSLEALSHLAEASVEDVLTILETPIAARVITDVPGSRLRLRFAHVAIRESLYDDIPVGRRIQLHRSAAQVLERVYGKDLEPHLAELAHHFLESRTKADTSEAIAYACRAAERAVSLLAYEEAVRLYRVALQGHDFSLSAKDLAYCDILLALGDAQSLAGDEAGWKATFLRAAELGRRLDLPGHLARAALGYGGRHVWGRAGGDPHLLPLLEEGLAVLGERNRELKSKLLARLAGARRDDRLREPRESLGKQAVALARQAGDPATLAFTLEGLHAALWRPDNPKERLAIADETVRLAGGAGLGERARNAHEHRLFALLELGDMATVYVELAAIDRLTEELREPAQQWPPAAMRAVLTLFEGQFEEAESSAELAFRLRSRANPSDAVLAHALQVFELGRVRGRLATVAGTVREAAQHLRWYPVLRCAVTVLDVELGRAAEAQASFADLAGADFSAVPFDNKWVFSMSLLSEAACALGDLDRVNLLYAKLLPYADRNSFAAADACSGSVARYLGMLASATGRFAVAVEHYEHAIDWNTRAKALPSLASTQHDFATMLMTRCGPGDEKRARALLGLTLGLCDRLAMPVLRAKAIAALERLEVGTPHEPRSATATAATDSPPPRPASLPAVVSPGRPHSEDGTFRLEGEYWTVCYNGLVVRLRDGKGMRILAQLLARPGRPQASLDLERIGALNDEATARAIASNDAGPLIDGAARRAYRERLAELHELIENASTLGDADTLGKMREEVDFITHELSVALGIGGRPRRAGSVAERSRLNVTRAVKSAVHRIALADAGLAAHLEATVHTGAVCVYTPDPRSPVAWRIESGG